MLYFDTSALLPYYRNEASSKDIESLLLGLDGPALISELTEVEVASALARWVLTDEISEPQANRLEGAFREDLQAGRWSCKSMCGRHFQLAREWLATRKTSLRTLDALHLACAREHNARLVTLDRAMHEAACFFGLDTWDELTESGPISTL